MCVYIYMEESEKSEVVVSPKIALNEAEMKVQQLQVENDEIKKLTEQNKRIEELLLEREQLMNRVRMGGSTNMVPPKKEISESERLDLEVNDMLKKAGFKPFPKNDY